MANDKTIAALEKFVADKYNVYSESLAKISEAASNGCHFRLVSLSLDAEEAHTYLREAKATLKEARNPNITNEELLESLYDDLANYRLSNSTDPVDRVRDKFELQAKQLVINVIKRS